MVIGSHYCAPPKLSISLSYCTVHLTDNLDHTPQVINVAPALPVSLALEPLPSTQQRWTRSEEMETELGKIKCSSATCPHPLSYWRSLHYQGLRIQHLGLLGFRTIWGHIFKPQWVRKTVREGSRLQRTLLVCANRRRRNTYTRNELFTDTEQMPPNTLDALDQIEILHKPRYHAQFTKATSRTEVKVSC